MKNLLFACIIGCTITFLSGCGQDQSLNESDSGTPVRPVRYIKVQEVEQALNRTFSGTAEAAKESVLSFKVAGTVDVIPVKVGDRVVTGTLLAELDKTDLLVDLESARAGLKASQADVKSAQTSLYTTQSNYERIQKLYENDNVSLSEFEQARGNYVTAQAQLDAANSRVVTETAKEKAAWNQLQYSKLAAPFNGIINQVSVEENEEISPGAPILTLSGLGNLEVKVNVSDVFITRIQKGMAVKISFPAIEGEEFEGVVAEVPYATSDAPTYPISIIIQSLDKALRPGMAAQVLFFFGDGSEGSVIHVPTDGVGEEDGQNFVYVIEPQKENEGKVVKRPVVIGDLTERGFLIKEGLSSGEIVATSGLQLLIEGMSVKLLNDPVKEW